MTVDPLVHQRGTESGLRRCSTFSPSGAAPPPPRPPTPHPPTLSPPPSEWKRRPAAYLPTSPRVEAASRRLSPHKPPVGPSPHQPQSRSGVPPLISPHAPGRADLPTSPLRTSAPQALDCCKNYSSLCVRSTPASHPPTTPPPNQPGTARLRTRASQQATPPPNPHAYPPAPPNKPPPNTLPFTIYYSPFTIPPPHHHTAPRDRPGSLPCRPHPPPPFHARPRGQQFRYLTSRSVA
jgi:hypothetical protein